MSFPPGSYRLDHTDVMKSINAPKDNNRKMADYKPEIFFIGQIVGGSDFPTDLDGLFVEASLKYGENWKLMEKTSTI